VNNNQQNEHSVEEIEVYLQQLEKIKRQYSEECNYIEADKINEKIKQIKSTLNLKKKKNLENQHINEVNLLEENFSKDMEMYNGNWEQKMKDFEEYSRKTEEDMNARHKNDMETLAKQLESNVVTNVKYPPEYLDLRRSEQILSRQQRFKEAEFVKQKRLALERDTIQKTNSHKNDKFKGKLENLAHKQLLEKQALRKKIESTLDEMEKERKRGDDNMSHKYNNRRQVLLTQQHQEKLLSENENMLKKRMASGKYPSKPPHLLKTTNTFQTNQVQPKIASKKSFSQKSQKDNDVQDAQSENNEKPYSKEEPIYPDEKGHQNHEEEQHNLSNHEQIQQEV